jgi:hypothetical protein
VGVVGDWCLVVVDILGCVCQSENDDVWGGTGKILGGGGTALEPADLPDFPKLKVAFT